jgi:hypothetical protein
MTTGQNDSAKDKMEAALKLLDEYEKGIGLPLYFENKEFEQVLDYTEIKTYLEYSKDELKQLTVEDCATTQYQLTKFAFQLQRLLNRETQRVQWCDSELNRLIGKVWNDYKAYKLEEKIICFINDDSYAERVFKIREYAHYRVTRLNFIALSIKDFGENLRNIQKIKEREYNG